MPMTGAKAEPVTSRAANVFRSYAAVSLLVNVAIATLLTWPLAARLRTDIPLGQETTPTVPYFNLWTLRWNADRIGHGFANYWNAPIFAPSRGMFARSEAQPLTGAVFAMLRGPLRDIAAYNLIVIGFVLLNGIAGVALARRLGADYVPSLLVGAIAQALPFVFVQFGVLQLICVFPMLFAITYLFAYQSTQQMRHAVAVGLWFAVCDFTSGYYAMFLAIILVTLAPVVLLGAVPLKRLARHGLTTALLTVAIIAPFAISQAHETKGTSWSRATVSGLGTQLRDYVELAPRAFGPPVWSDDANNNGILESPGTYLAGLGLVGFVVAACRRQRRVALAGVLSSATAIILSMGFHLSLLGWRPYAVIYEHVPGFDRLRSPFRFSVVLQLMLLIFAALALQQVWRWKGRTGQILAVLITLLAVLESVPLGLDRITESGLHGMATTRVPDVANFDWVRYLRDAPSGAVAMVPFAEAGAASHFADTTVAMLAGQEHKHPLANGYTGLFPKDFDPLWYAMDHFASRCGVQQLHARNIRYLVIAHDWFNADSDAYLQTLGYRKVFDGNSRAIYDDMKRYPFKNEC